MEQDEPTDRPASPRARDEARQRGHVARSRDAVFAVVTAVACGWLAAQGPSLWQAWTHEIRGGITSAYRPGTTSEELLLHWQQMLINTAQWLAPGLVLLMMAAAAGHWLQHGPLWLPQRLVPDFTRLDPAANSVRWWAQRSSTRPLGVLCKSMTLALVIAAWSRAHVGVWSQLARLEPQQIVAEGSALAGQLAALVVVALAALGGVDFIWRWHRFERQLRMSAASDENDVQAVRNDLRSPGRAVARDQQADHAPR